MHSYIEYCFSGSRHFFDSSVLADIKTAPQPQL